MRLAPLGLACALSAAFAHYAAAYPASVALEENENVLNVKRRCIEPAFKGIGVEIVRHKPLWEQAYSFKDPSLNRHAREVHDQANLAEFVRLTERNPPKAGTQAWRRLMGLRRLAAAKAEAEKLDELERGALANCIAYEYVQYAAKGPGPYDGILAACGRAEGNCSSISRVADELLRAMNVETRLVLTGLLDKASPSACQARKPTHEMVDFYVEPREGLPPHARGWLRLEGQRPCSPDPGRPCAFGAAGMECPGPEPTEHGSLLPD